MLSSPLLVLFGRHARVLFEVFGEKGLVWKIEFVAHILDGVPFHPEQGFSFEHHIIVNPVVGRLATDLSHNGGKIFGCDAQSFGVSINVSVMNEMLVNLVDELFEYLLLPRFVVRRVEDTVIADKNLMSHIHKCGDAVACQFVLIDEVVVHQTFLHKPLCTEAVFHGIVIDMEHRHRHEMLQQGHGNKGIA